MRITPDQLILWQYGFVKLNATIVTTWGLMLLLTIGARLITRKLTSEVITSRWQAALEILITGIDEQIKEVGLTVPEHYHRLHRHAVHLHCDGQSVHDRAGLRASDQLTLDDRGARACAFSWRYLFLESGDAAGAAI